jgi:hypothetical protein
MGAQNRPTRIRSTDRPACSEFLSHPTSKKISSSKITDPVCVNTLLLSKHLVMIQQQQAACGQTLAIQVQRKKII